MAFLIRATILTFVLATATRCYRDAVRGAPAPDPLEFFRPYGQWVVSGNLTYRFRYHLERDGTGEQWFAGKRTPVRWIWERPVLRVVEDLGGEYEQVHAYRITRAGPNHYHGAHPVRGRTHFTRPGRPPPEGTIGWKDQ